jgi:hypothetical protein
MAEVEVAFDVPEEIGGARSWFVQALQPLADVRRRERRGAELVLEKPRVTRLTEPGADSIGFEIVIAARRIETTPVPASWCPEYVIERFDIEELDLGVVMVFRLFALHGETYVLASCVERPPALWRVFEDFLKQVEARYPALGPFWQATAAQQRERMRAELRRKFESGKSQRGGDRETRRKGEEDAETRGRRDAGTTPARRRGRKGADAEEMNKICAAWYEVQHRVTQTDFCNAKGISVSCLRRWLKGYPYPEPGRGE